MNLGSIETVGACSAKNDGPGSAVVDLPDTKGRGLSADEAVRQKREQLATFMEITGG